MTKDFDMTKHETDFVSLTNQEINKQLEEVQFILVRKLKRKLSRTLTSPKWNK